jgi:uncharacterized repeat protein (TIGR02543 family)
MNYQVDFIVTTDSELAEVIDFEIQPLGGNTTTVVGTNIDTNVYISLRDTTVGSGGLLRPSIEVPQEYEIWRVEMIYSSRAGNEYNDATLEFEVDIQLTAWQFNYAESQGGSYGGSTSTDPYAAYRQLYADYLLEFPTYDGDIAQFVVDLISGELAEKDVFTVTFDSNGGSAVASQQVVDGLKATRPTDPTRLGYTFQGWFIDGLDQWVFGAYIVTEDLTLVARWRSNEATTYDIFYVLGYDNLVQIVSVEYGQNITAITPTRTGYTFGGWFDANSVQYTGGIYQLTQNFVVYATWTANTYTLTLETNGGTIDGSTTRSVTFGSNFTLPVPTTELNNFTGWFNGSDKITDKFGASLATWSTTSNVTLSALYFIEVSSAQQLSDIRNDLSASYALTQDISLTGEWTPIGNEANRFTGILDGNSFTISNLTVTATQSYVGLFGYSTGVIRGLKLANVTINVSGPIDGPIYAGAVAGYSTGTLTNIETLSGSVAARARAANIGYVGGMIGYHSSTKTFQNLINRLDVSGIADALGGLVGLTQNNINLSLSLNHGNITGINNVGGLIGRLNANGNSSGSYSNLENTGNILGSQSIGGLFGYAQSGNYSYLTNTGDIRGNSNNVGGISGLFDLQGSYNSIRFATNYGRIVNLSQSEGTEIINSSYTSNTGGIAGYYDDGLIEYSYNYGDVYGTYSIGGIVGSSGSMSMNELTNEADVFGSAYVGGLIGYASGRTATKLLNLGKIYVSNSTADSSAYSIGGIFGRQSGVSISLALNNGSFEFNPNTYRFENVGGIVGESEGGNLINSANTSDIEIPSSSSFNSYRSGGLIGLGSSVSLGYVYNSGNVSSGRNVGGLVGRANNSIYVYYAINLGNMSVTTSTTEIGSIVGYTLPGSNDLERLYFTNTNTANGVVVDGIAFGTKVTDLSLLDLDFFTTMLEWSTDTWSFEGLDIANGVYPVLKFTLPEEEPA